MRFAKKQTLEGRQNEKGNQLTSSMQYECLLIPTIDKSNKTIPSHYLLYDAVLTTQDISI